MQFHKQSESFEGEPSSKLVLFFTKSNWKWVIIPAVDTKCPHMALKYITPKKPWGSGVNVVRYITLHMQEEANYSKCDLFCRRFHWQSYLFMFQREEAIRKNHIVTTGGEGVADTWKVERPKSLDLLQDTSYFRAKTMVCLNCHLCLACLRESWCVWTHISWYNFAFTCRSRVKVVYITVWCCKHIFV